MSQLRPTFQTPQRPSSRQRLRTGGLSPRHCLQARGGVEPSFGNRRVLVASARGARESSHAGTRLNRAPRQACNLQRRMFKRAMLVLRACHAA